MTKISGSVPVFCDKVRVSGGWSYEHHGERCGGIGAAQCARTGFKENVSIVDWDGLGRQPAANAWARFVDDDFGLRVDFGQEVGAGEASNAPSEDGYMAFVRRCGAI